MNLHEYQAKKLFAEYGLPIPNGVACKTVAEAKNSESIVKDGKKVVIKCQVHAGGRGKAGGVKVVSNFREIEDFINSWTGKNLVTFQTDANGQPVSCFLIEECTDIDRELYLGAVVDRVTQRIVFMASTEGGMDIEKVAHETPHLIHTAVIDPLVGAQAYQARELGFKLNLDIKQIQQFTNIFINLANMFIEKDFSLVEVNPLVVSKEGKIICLDAKVNLDSNALYRQKDLLAIRDITQEDAREAHAAQFELNYVALHGNIGCMVNGAGLAMGTMDIISLHGGFPANFLDVGGGANKERVAEAFKIILSDTNIKSVLVNIFGGIVRCDMIALGIIAAIEEVGVKVPVVVRLEGNNADLGRELLSNSGLNIQAATSLTQAAKLAVAATEGK